MRPVRISAPRKLSKPYWTASSKRATPARSIAASGSLACKPSTPSIASTSTITRPAYSAKSCILRLLDLGFLEKGTAVVLIGNPGVGKTFLAKIIAWRACQANRRVLFTTAMDMLNHLLASQVDHSLIRKLKLYTEPDFSPH